MSGDWLRLMMLRARSSVTTVSGPGSSASPLASLKSWPEPQPSSSRLALRFSKRPGTYDAAPRPFRAPSAASLALPSSRMGLAYAHDVARRATGGSGRGRSARSLARAGVDPPSRRLAAGGLGDLPAAARRLDHPAEARARGDAELAAGPGAAALSWLLHLSGVRAAAHPSPAAAARPQP